MKRRRPMVTILSLLLALAAMRSGAGTAAESDDPRMNDSTVQLMLGVIQKESVFEKMRAATALGQARVTDPSAVQALVGMLEDEYPPARVSALYALGRTRQVDLAASILPRLTDEEASVRIAACSALAEMGAGDAAGKLPLDDDDASVRLAASMAAKRLAQPQSVPALVKRFSVEEDLELKTALLHALTAIGGAGGAKAAVAGLDASDPAMRAAALDWFAAVGPEVAPVEALSSRWSKLLSARSLLVRRSAARAGMACIPAVAEPGVIKLVADSDHQVRTVALDALGASGSRAAWAAFGTAQEDAARYVRRRASVAYLRHLERDDSLRAEVERAALAAIESGNAGRKREGVWMLGEIRSRAGSPRILDLAIASYPQASVDTPRPSRDTRMSALVIWTVMRTGDPAGGELATGYFNCAAPELRIHAARALGTIRYEPAVPKMAKVVKHFVVIEGEAMFTYGGRERTNALRSLGQIGSDAALGTLVDLIVSKKPMESSQHIALMLEAVVRHKYTGRDAVKRMGQAVGEALKNRNLELAHTLADGVVALGGERPTVPPLPQEDPRPGYDRFFLNKTGTR